MSARLWMPAIICGGILLVLAGVHKWHRDSGPEQTVVAFMEALRKSDRRAALQLLTPKQYELANLRSQNFASAWTKPPDPEDAPRRFKYKIEKIDVVGDTATVHVVFSEGVFRLRPILSLELSRTGLWKINRISNVKTDPLWQRRQGEKLSREIEESLRQLPSTTVVQ